MSHSVVIGLGQTGVSCARYLASKGERFAIADTRYNPPGLADIEREFPDVELWLGPLDVGLLCEASQLVVSPGIAISEPAIARAMDAGVPVIGDVELFAREVAAPVIAITGSNAKSTVTSLVGHMAKKAGIDVGVGGNIGLPVLELLAQG
ncbi:UDP-N-acetylmuramoyl-L-alanine--D-glutamate ligase, partial [Oceanospirillum sp. HFRX-1_2]